MPYSENIITFFFKKNEEALSSQDSTYIIPQNPEKSFILAPVYFRGMPPV